ncbi:MAG: sigma 54-interacting transcriptional regulator [Deltaproteobacteria bacterium]|nr:sigma 54-interacting transcriptional regulator [Deltaproteobacteria bacterium]
MHSGGGSGSTISVGDERAFRSEDTFLAPTLFLVIDCGRPATRPARYSLADVDAVEIGRGTARSAVRDMAGSKRRLVLRVPDHRVSQAHASVTRVGDRWMLKDAGSKNGTVRNGVAQASALLEDGDLLELGYTFFMFRSAVSMADSDPIDLDLAEHSAQFPELLTLFPPLGRKLTALESVAPSTLPVMILGETGTGKEQVARALHRMSRRHGAMVPINCGSLPANLIESELFGYRKGAFSGAVEDRPGLISAADHGTLFLDEIGDMPLATQVTFLRVLQEREVLPIGARKPIAVDFRAVAATHRDLHARVASGEFRGDLLARIGAFTLTLPPLRARREDLGLLVATMLHRIAPGDAERLVIRREAARLLFRYDWPFNIRELEKSLSAALHLAGDGVIDAKHFPESMVSACAGGMTVPTVGEERGGRPLTEDDALRLEQLIALFSEHRGNISAVARAMGKPRVQVQRWIRRYRLDPKAFNR